MLRLHGLIRRRTLNQAEATVWMHDRAVLMHTTPPVLPIHEGELLSISQSLEATSWLQLLSSHRLTPLHQEQLFICQEADLGVCHNSCPHVPHSLADMLAACCCILVR